MKYDTLLWNMVFKKNIYKSIGIWINCIFMDYMTCVILKAQINYI